VRDLRAPSRRRWRILGPQAQNEHVIAGLAGALIHGILNSCGTMARKK
jgi:hypothetical protein